MVFALSALACSVILVLFARGRAEWSTAFWLQLAAAAFVVTGIACALAFRRGRLRLRGIPLAQLARVFLAQLVYVYVASAVTLTLLAFAVVYGITRVGAHSFALAVVAGLWLALWLAPGIAAFTSWFKLRDA